MDFPFSFFLPEPSAKGQRQSHADERARGVYGNRMPPEPALDERPSSSDHNGVDLSQIREMLGLTPEQRLARIQEFVESVLAIRELNEARPVR
jgi:hypothetical protein